MMTLNTYFTMWAMLPLPNRKNQNYTIYKYKYTCGFM